MPGPQRAVDDVGEEALRVDVLLEHLAWPERDDATRSNTDFLSGPRIPAFTGAFASHDKISKPCDLDGLSFLQHGLQKIQHKFDDVGRFIFRNADLFENFIRNISLSHAVPSPAQSPMISPPTEELPHRWRVPFNLREVTNSVKKGKKGLG
jgi:hypothetical protein